MTQTLPHPVPPLLRGGLRVFAALLLSPWAADGQWVEEPGEGWFDLTAYHLDTREAFGADGEKRDFVAGGHAVSTSLFVTVAGGLAPGLDGWIQLPYHRLRYDDFSGDRLRRGVGDTRVYLRTAPLRLAGSELPFALRGGVKMPVGDFAVDSEVIPLGDGQRDWELLAELGHSFHPLPAYVSGWVGHRWREPNERSLRDFGDEWFFLLQGGGTAGRLGFEAAVEGWTGAAPVIEGVRVPSAERRMLQITPSVNYRLGPGRLEAGARFPLTGRNLPAGTALVAGYFADWSF